MQLNIFFELHEAFFGGSKKSLEVDMSQIEINELINPIVAPDLYSANVNGWRCLMKGKQTHNFSIVFFFIGSPRFS